MKNVDEVTGERVRALRKKLGLPEWQFWGAIGVGQSSGHRHEVDHPKIPESLRILIFMRYVLGIEFDNTPAGIRQLKRLAKLQREDFKKPQHVEQQ